MEIILRGVTKVFPGGVQALGGVDLTIPRGMFGLLGPNGAGKTTLMRILAGILPASSGSIDVWGNDGRTAAGRLAVKRTLGYLPQDLGLYPDLTAREFLDYVGLLKGMDEARARQRRVADLLQMVALDGAADRRLRAFSGGMRRRVGIAQALLADPRLLIVDEPTAGLDPEERIRFRNLLAELAGDRTVLLSTHIVEDVAQTCRRLAVMAAGRVRFEGTAEVLLESARGRVWTVATAGERPGGDVTVVSMVHAGAEVRYRVVGEVGSGDAVPAEPTLEDGYVWLMRGARAEALQGAGG